MELEDEVLVVDPSELLVTELDTSLPVVELPLLASLEAVRTVVVTEPWVASVVASVEVPVLDKLLVEELSALPAESAVVEACGFAQQARSPSTALAATVAVADSRWPLSTVEQSRVGGGRSGSHEPLDHVDIATAATATILGNFLSTVMVKVKDRRGAGTAQLEPRTADGARGGFRTTLPPACSRTESSGGRGCAGFAWFLLAWPLFSLLALKQFNFREWESIVLAILGSAAVGLVPTHRVRPTYRAGRQRATQR